MKVLNSKYNFLSLEKKYSSIDNSSIVIIPIIYSPKKNDSNKLSSPHKLIFDASKKLEKYDEEMDAEICFTKGICSTSLFPIYGNHNTYNDSKVNAELLELLKKGKKIVTISNSTVSTLFYINAFQNEYSNLSILQLDAKARLKNESISAPFEDKVSYFLNKSGVNLLQVGIRNISKDEYEYKTINQIHQFLSCEIKLGMYGNQWQEFVNNNLKNNVLIKIDLSVFDPSVFENIENPEPGGLLWDEVLYLIKIIGSDKNIVGIEFSGISSKSKNKNSYYFLAKFIYKLLNYPV